MHKKEDVRCAFTRLIHPLSKPALIKRWLTFLPVLALLTNSAIANAADASGKSAVTAEAIGVREVRGSDGRCHVSLKFQGDALTNYCSLLSVRPIVAIDDTGGDLCPTNTTSPAGWSISGNAGFAPVRGWHQERPSRTRFGSLTLRDTSRSANTIKDLQGELELYSPTLQNGGAVVVDDFRARPGVELQSPALEKLGVRITFHTKESFESAKKLSDRRNPSEIRFPKRSAMRAICSPAFSATRRIHRAITLCCR